MTGGREGFSFGAGWATCFTCVAPSRSIDERAFISPRLDIQADLRLGAPRAAHASDTEREAIEAGDVWWDADLFAGNPDWAKLLAVAAARLRPRSRRSSTVRSTSSAACSTIGRSPSSCATCRPRSGTFSSAQKFFAMIIPKEYGGLGFSAYRAFGGDPQALDALDLGRGHRHGAEFARAGRAAARSSAPRRSRITGCRGSPTRARSPASGSPARRRARMPRR